MDSARYKLWAQGVVEKIVKKKDCVSLLSWRYGQDRGLGRHGEDCRLD